MTWILYEDDYDTWPIGTVSDVDAAMLVAANPETAGVTPEEMAAHDDDRYQIVGTRWSLQRLDQLVGLSVQVFPPALNGRISSWWSKLPSGHLVEIPAAIVHGLPDGTRDTHPDKRPTFKEERYGFESSYTLGANYEVTGTDLARVRAAYEAELARFTDDPAGYVIDRWLTTGLVVTALRFLRRPENAGLAPRLVEAARALTHERLADKPGDFKGLVAVCSCNWTSGSSFAGLSDGDRAFAFAEHALQAKP